MESTKPSIYTILFVSAFLLFLHALGLKFYYYWQIAWYDRVVHFVAGFLIFLVFYYFVTRIKSEARTSFSVMLAGLGLAFIVSIGWELFELSIGAIFATLDRYIIDTWLDVNMDMLGAGTALVYYYRSK